MRRGTGLVVCVMLAGLTGAAARDQAAPSGASVASLAWMAGSWAGPSGTTDVEEHWMAPRGGTMIGMHRDVRDEKTTGFEFLRIEARDGRLVYLASPGGRPPVPFTAIEVSDRRVVFENAAHDFPQRILYWHEKGFLHARIEGTTNGKPASDEWRWAPATLAGTK